MILLISGLTWYISFYHHYDKMPVYALEKGLNLAHSFSRISLWSLGSVFLGLWEAKYHGGQKIRSRGLVNSGWTRRRGKGRGQGPDVTSKCLFLPPVPPSHDPLAPIRPQLLVSFSSQTGTTTWGPDVQKMVQYLNHNTCVAVPPPPTILI